MKVAISKYSSYGCRNFSTKSVYRAQMYYIFFSVWLIVQQMGTGNIGFITFTPTQVSVLHISRNSTLKKSITWAKMLESTAEIEAWLET